MLGKNFKEHYIDKDDGSHYLVKWDDKKKEYRVFERQYGSYVDICLGSLNVNNLVEYIKTHNIKKGE